MASVIDRIIGQLQQHPTREVVRDTNRHWSAGEMLATIEDIGQQFEAHGVTAGDRVAILMPNCCEYVAAILACMVKSITFVPIPHQNVNQRQISILSHCEPKMLLVQKGDQSWGAISSHVNGIVLELERSRRDPDERKPEILKASCPVYCVYTSGSTGAPKGVLIGHSSLVNFVENTIATFDLNNRSRAFCLSPFHFDGAFGSIFSVLAAGGTLVISSTKYLTPTEFVDKCDVEKITHTSFSPSFLSLLCSSRAINRLVGTPLRTIGLGGEDCRREDLLHFKRANPSVRIFNRYGPTETTVVVGTMELTADILNSDDKIPFGRPDNGVEFRIVRDGNVCELSNAVGELYIGGVQVMIGYLKDAELSEQVLRRDIEVGRVYYKTGDMVYRTDAGNFVFHGRVDNIVNRNGVRISVDEVTAALNSIDAVKEVISFHRPTDTSGVEIISVVAAELNEEVVRNRLSNVLPRQMMPDRILLVDKIPRNDSGKADMTAIRELHNL